MNCYYHQDTVAIGVCRSCLRGLCPQCAVDLGAGLACRDRCEQDVKDLLTYRKEGGPDAIGGHAGFERKPARLPLTFIFLILGGGIGYWAYKAGNYPVVVLGLGLLLIGAFRILSGGKRAG